VILPISSFAYYVSLTEQCSCRAYSISGKTKKAKLEGTLLIVRGNCSGSFDKMKYCGILNVGPNVTLSALKRANWEVGEMRKVIFFKGTITPVYLTSVDHPSFGEHLLLIDTEEPICLDMEWKVSFNAAIKNHPSLFQFSTRNATLIVRHLSIRPSNVLRKFLETHEFYGKDTGNDISRMKSLFGCDFEIKLENVSTTRLIPYGFSRKFNLMVETFVGIPLFSIKDKAVTMSNWERPKLAFAQVLYSAYDVVALRMAFPKLPIPVLNSEKVDFNPIFKEVKVNMRERPKKKKRVLLNAMSQGEVANALKKITFPIREPVPLFKRNSYEIIPIDEALERVLIMFNNDPNEIPHTLEFVDDGEEIPDEECEQSKQVVREKPEPVKKEVPIIRYLSDDSEDFDEKELEGLNI
jgi:hypothetical protein